MLTSPKWSNEVRRFISLGRLEDEVGHLNRKIPSDFPHGKMVTTTIPNTKEGAITMDCQDYITTEPERKRGQHLGPTERGGGCG